MCVEEARRQAAALRGILGMTMERGNDHTKALVREYLHIVRPRHIVWRAIAYAYENGYERVSDGISFPLRFIAQLEFSGLKMKHPLGVAHDCLYRMGAQHPLVQPLLLNYIARGKPIEDSKFRAIDDDWFGKGLHDFGHWFRAYSWEWGLRLGGWKAFGDYRRKERKGDFRHILPERVRWEDVDWIS